MSHARGSPAQEVHRAQILCRFEAGETITQIARALNTTRPSVRKWVDKALAMGASAALKDTWHRPHAPVITEEAKAWVVHLACSKPKEFGYAAELWTRSSLALHVRQHAVKAGHPSLAKAVKATVHRILAGQELHPERVQYYLERRDPDFEAKMIGLARKTGTVEGLKPMASTRKQKNGRERVFRRVTNFATRKFHRIGVPLRRNMATRQLVTFRRIQGSNRSPEKHARSPAIFARHSPPACFSSLLAGRRPMLTPLKNTPRTPAIFARHSPPACFSSLLVGRRPMGHSLRSRLCKWLKMGAPILSRDHRERFQSILRGKVVSGPLISSRPCADAGTDGRCPSGLPLARYSCCLWCAEPAGIRSTRADAGR